MVPFSFAMDIFTPPFAYDGNAAQTNPIATPDSSITYTFTASYPGCADSVQAVSAGVEPLPDIALMPPNTVCVGSTVQMSPAVSPSRYSSYAYQWEPATFFNNVSTVSAIYTATNTGAVSLKVSTPHGCIDRFSQLISVSPIPFVNAGKDMTVLEAQVINLRER